MSKHTPGPWRWCGQESQRISFNDGTVCISDGTSRICDCGHIASGSSEHDYIIAKVRWRGNADQHDCEDLELSTNDKQIFKANVRLIAKAPEMFEFICLVAERGPVYASRALLKEKADELLAEIEADDD